MLLKLSELFLKFGDVNERACHVIDGGGNIFVHFLKLLHVLLFSDALDVEHLLTENKGGFLGESADFIHIMHEVVVHVFEFQTHFVLNGLNIGSAKWLHAVLASLVDSVHHALNFVLGVESLA